MRFTIYPPCPALAPYVKYLAVSENEQAGAYRVIPGTSLVMGFQYSGSLAYRHQDNEVPLDKAGVTGLLDTYRTFYQQAFTHSVLVAFNETGAAAFINCPLHELFNESLSLLHFFGPRLLTETEERLCSAQTDWQRIQIIEQLLLNQLYPTEPDKLVLAAVDRIKASQGTVRITELTRQLHTSASPLEKRFRKVVGTSPKKFATLIRIQQMMNSLDQGNYQTALHLAGYYDQAHFIHDFKRFTGLTPEMYLQGKKTK
jgi:AraC-like DNA-binding protein